MWNNLREVPTGNETNKTEEQQARESEPHGSLEDREKIIFSLWGILTGSPGHRTNDSRTRVYTTLFSYEVKRKFPYKNENP